MRKQISGTVRSAAVKAESTTPPRRGHAAGANPAAKPGLKKVRSRPGAGWTIVASPVGCLSVAPADRARIIFVLARPAAGYAAELGDRRNLPQWLDDSTAPYASTIRECLSAAVSGNRVFCDTQTWAEWDNLLQSCLGTLPKEAPSGRGAEFNPDVAAAEAEKLGVAVIRLPLKPPRMRLTFAEAKPGKEKSKKPPRRARTLRELRGDTAASDVDPDGDDDTGSGDSRRGNDYDWLPGAE